MTDLTTDDVHGRTLAAFFDTKEAADHATADLVAAGLPREHIKLTEGADPSTGSSTTSHESTGFWDELKSLFMPDEDRYGYAEGLRRGGYLLSVRSDEANYTRVLDILDRDGAVDMDEREASWRSSGWTGYQAGSAAVGSTATSATTSTTRDAVTTGAGVAALATTTDTTRNSARAAPVDTRQDGRDEVIPIYEESLNVGKRDVSHGRVRLRSYVVETPVSEQVSLRQEQVQVERHPVDRLISATDAVFQDRVIEVEEHAEEAVIAKEARVKEEISLRKTVENREQTLTDTVRRTEVEVEDMRTGHALVDGQSVAGTFDTSRIVEHMPVLASDGTQVGTVDHLDGADRIKLTKSASPDGQHHFIPLAWIDHVDTHVHLNRAAADVRSNWSA